MIGLPLVFLSPGVILVFSIGLTLALGRGGGALVLCTLASTLILWIAGTIALVVARGHMNSEFEKRNRIKLTYSLPREVETRYLKLLHWLEKMAPSEFFEIVQRDDGNFDFSHNVIVEFDLPPYVKCNLDFGCLKIGPDTVFIMPDGVLIFAGNEYYLSQWEEVSLKVNNIRGKFECTEYRSELVHGRVRKDGGLDQRYNSRFANVGHRVMKPISQYGVMSIKIGNNVKLILLSSAKDSVLGFDSAFGEWDGVQKRRSVKEAWRIHVRERENPSLD